MSSVFNTIRSVIIFKAFGILSEMVGILLLARYLSGPEFGGYVLFQGSVLFLGAIGSIGVDKAIIKRVSGNEGCISKIVGSAVCLKFLTWVIISLGIILFQGHINDYFGESLALWIIPGVFFFFFAKLALHILHGELKVPSAEKLRFSRQIIYFVSISIGVLLGYGVFAGITAFLFSWFAVLLSSIYLIDSSITVPSRREVRSLLEFGKYDYVASSIGSTLHGWTDTLLIGFFLGPELAGAYEIAWQISGSVLLVSRAVGMVVFPEMSSKIANHGKVEMSEMISDSLVAALLLPISGVFGLYVIGDDLLFLINSEYAVVALPLVILTGSRLFESVNNIYSQIFYGLDQPQFPAISTVVFVVINIVLNVVLINAIGVLGAAVATTLAYFCSLAVNSYGLNSYFEFLFPWKMISFVVFAGVVMDIILLFNPLTSELSGVPFVAISIIIGGISYTGVLLLFNDFRVFVQRILQKI